MSSSAWEDAQAPVAETGTAEAKGAARLGRNLTALAGGQLVTWTMTLL